MKPSISAQSYLHDIFAIAYAHDRINLNDRVSCYTGGKKVRWPEQNPGVGNGSELKIPAPEGVIACVQYF